MNDTLQKMELPAYWYGQKPGESAYSFVSDVASYADGVKENYHILPENIQKKEQLSFLEAQLVRALQEMKEDLKLSKETRPGRWLLTGKVSRSQTEGSIGTSEENRSAEMAYET
jgi:hypothetical protein